MGSMIYILAVVLTSMGSRCSSALDPVLGNVQRAGRDSTPPTTHIPTTPYVCKDTLSSSLCRYYSAGCKAQGAQLKWAITYCASSCGLCTDVTRQPCHDWSDCSYYSTPERCRSTMWTDTNCARTCGYCNSDNCYDRDTNCKHLPSEVCTGPFLGWATTNCAKTCGLCHVHTTNSGSPTPPTVPLIPTTPHYKVPTPPNGDIVG